MGIHFGNSMQNIIGKAIVPLHDLLKVFGSKEDSDHELLWQCYASGQMPEADLEHHVASDPKFAALFERQQDLRH